MLRRVLRRKPKAGGPPPPVRAMLDVLDDLWLAYGLVRDQGVEAGPALDIALAQLLGGQQVGQLLAFMQGGPEGQSLRHDTLEQAEMIYQKLRVLPDWPGLNQ